MSEVITAIGAIIGVSAAQPATEDQAGYAALTYTEVGEVVDAGTYGGTAEIVTHTPIRSGVVEKRKGSKDYGNMSLKLGRDLTDAGQTLLKDAFDGAEENTIHSFSVTLQNGDIQYFQGLVASFTTELATANTIVGAMADVALTTTVLEA